MKRGTLLLSLVLGAACGAPRPAAPPPSGVAAVTVAPVENRTGSALVISGDTYVERWIGRQRRTVAEVMTHELAKALAAQGFAVGGAGAPSLRVVLRRFEPDQPQLSHVSVALSATLVDADGTVRWSEERDHWLIATPESPKLASAYESAARTVARRLVSDWQPAR
jgi:hypothetical protein